MGNHDKKQVAFEGAVDVQQCMHYLEDVLSGLKSGTLHIQNGERSVTIRPAANIRFEIEAKQKDDRESFAMRLSWQHLPEVPAADLVIGDAEPAGPKPGPAPDDAESPVISGEQRQKA